MRIITLILSVLVVTSIFLSSVSASDIEEEMVKVIIAVTPPSDALMVSERIASMGDVIEYVQNYSIGRINGRIKQSHLTIIENYTEVTSIIVNPETRSLMSVFSESGYMGIDIPQLHGFTGTGIMGQVQDDGLDLTHPDYDVDFRDNDTKTISTTYHGTHAFGILFCKGANPLAEGSLPDATTVFGILGRLENRQYDSVLHLWNGQFKSGNAGQHGLFQSNSWGSSPYDGLYDSRTQAADAASYDFSKVLTVWGAGQGLGGAGSFTKEATSKNGLTVGGVNTVNNAILSDDSGGGEGAYLAGFGPAHDGRQKPDVVGPFDGIFSTDPVGSIGVAGDYSDFEAGTSGACPVVAGIVGLAYEMYIENYFQNNPYNFIPYSSTIKALIIADAYQYPLTQIDRDHQGWGLPDAENIYDLGANYHVIEDHPESLSTGEAWSRQIYVDGINPLKTTLTWLDPPALDTTGSGKSLINNLDLKLTAPDSTIYWGNNGLYNNLWSTAGNVANNQWSENTDCHDDLNNVENVFIETPQPGLWTVEVIGEEISSVSGAQSFSFVASGATEVHPQITVQQSNYGWYASPPYTSPDRVEINVDFEARDMMGNLQNALSKATY
ncbi:MAG: S8 family serine peptidase [Thermoplasmata archaeon]